MTKIIRVIFIFEIHINQQNGVDNKATEKSQETDGISKTGFGSAGNIAYIQKNYKRNKVTNKCFRSI